MRVRKASTPRTTILMRTSLTNYSFNFRLDIFYETTRLVMTAFYTTIYISTTASDVLFCEKW